jgi:hypothetical protein
MVFTYQELLQKYGNERQIRNALARKEIYLLSRGIYSEEPEKGKLYLAKRYPTIIFTGRSAFYHYGLSDAAPEKMEVTSPLGSTRIPKEEAEQSFQIPKIFGIGKREEENLPFYDPERMLIELFRQKRRYGFDYFKEVLNAYRTRQETLDFGKITLYLKRMEASERLLSAIREAF